MMRFWILVLRAIYKARNRNGITAVTVALVPPRCNVDFFPFLRHGK